MILHRAHTRHQITFPWTRIWRFKAAVPVRVDKIGWSSYQPLLIIKVDCWLHFLNRKSWWSVPASRFYWQALITGYRVELGISSPRVGTTKSSRLILTEFKNYVSTPQKTRSLNYKNDWWMLFRLKGVWCENNAKHRNRLALCGQSSWQTSWVQRRSVKICKVFWLNVRIRPFRITTFLNWDGCVNSNLVSSSFQATKTKV